MIAAKRVFSRPFMSLAFFSRQFRPQFSTFIIEQVPFPPKKPRTTPSKREFLNIIPGMANFELAVDFAKEDNVGRSIQELQVATRTWVDALGVSKFTKFEERQEIARKVNETLHFLYSSSSFNSLEFPSLLDSLVKLMHHRCLKIEAVIATIQFSSVNYTELKRLGLETSNFRVVYHLFTLLMRAHSTPKAMNPEIRKLHSNLRQNLIEALMLDQVFVSLQVYESFNLMAAIMGSGPITGETEVRTVELLYRLLENSILQVNDQSQLVLLMAILGHLPKKNPEMAASMASTFDSMQISKSKHLILSHFRKPQIEFLFTSLTPMERVFPQQTLAILQRVKGYLCSNFETLIAVLNHLAIKDDKILITLVNDELVMMLRLNLIDKMPEDKRIMLLSKAVTTLSRNLSFTHFEVRDKLLELYAKALLTCRLESIDYGYFNDYFYVQVSLRQGFDPSILKIADRLVEKVNKDKTNRLIHLRVLSSLLNCEVIEPTHPALEELAMKFLMIPKFESQIQEFHQFRALASSVQFWHYKLWKQIKNGDEVKVPEAFGLLVRAMIDSFNFAMQNKIKLDTKSIHRLAYAFDCLLIFGYFEDNLPLKHKVKTLTERLGNILVGNEVSDGPSFFEGSYLDRYSNSEEIFMQFLTSRGIKFERQKRVSMLVADFYLPEHDVLIEIDGVVHFTRAVIRDLLIKTQLKKDYLRAKGYRLYNFWTLEKEEQEKLEERFERMLNNISKDLRDGVVRTSNEDFTIHK
jgi:very-short-patch-repair endonuclease